jgi:hypothetical protein
MFLLLMICLAFSICNILKQVARTKSTARPMTLEELVAAGVSPTVEEIRDSENIQSHVEDPTPGTVHDSRSCEDGEIRSENKSGGKEDLSNVDVDMNELVVVKAASHPPAFVFGKSKVTADLIKEYENAGFNPVGDGRPPSGE